MTYSQVNHLDRLYLMTHYLVYQKKIYGNIDNINVDYVQNFMDQ
jgi:hypothetical protein